MKISLPIAATRPVRLSLLSAALWALVVCLLLPEASSAAQAQLDPATSHFFAVTSYGATGLESISFSVVDNADPAPPAVTVNSANDAPPVSGLAAIRVLVPDGVQLSRVQFLVNAAAAAESTTAPFVMSWNTTQLPPGEYLVAVKATDTAGGELTSDPVSVTVSVVDPVTIPDTERPVVSLLAPAAGSTLTGSVTVSASATDNVGVTKVEFYVNSVLQGTDSSAPYLFSWNTLSLANGSYTLSARAYDAAGNVADAASVTVTVFNDAVAPSVAFTAPGAGQLVGGTVPVTLAASDNVGVSRVEIYLNGLLQATLYAAPYSFAWDTSLVANGSYSWSAKAYDAAGNVGSAVPRVVQVLNDATPPTLSINPVTTPSTATSQLLSGSVQDNDQVASVTVQVGSQTPLNATVSANAWSLQLTGLALGDNQITVRATDRSGNRSAATTVIQILAPSQVPLTLADAQLALEIALRGITPTPEQLARLDVAPYVDGQSRPNGVVDTGDVVVILLKLVGKL
ncbi:hypothetical protein GMST_00880 [Geomonas silvestris]|uniref:Bacterial Ig-like domain-containing protein n=1 Tax=Geomonas silvestris TaxID=2740184 RepID=A0A6V8MD83_9BACT|nr:Ig-like domain-containing protein [Geomonas silvestris]GFO57763.1 hypothetical protein GMST_00880 [Geomonas silvestris]